MSIIGEMWEEDYAALEASIPAKLVKFAEWLEREGYKPVNYNMWTNSDLNYWKQSTWHTTEQLVKMFLKEIK